MNRRIKLIEVPCIKEGDQLLDYKPTEPIAIGDYQDKEPIGVVTKVVRDYWEYEILVDRPGKKYLILKMDNTQKVVVNRPEND